tara:strand:+ start:190 stop:966 length:777 start_codon:yes stop_codon:yes gene_type:complete
MFIDELITELCRDKLNVSRLTGFDKFIIMLEIRATNISSVIEFNMSTTDKEIKKYTVDINECLSVARSYDIKHRFDISVDDKLRVRGTLPRKLIMKDWFDVGLHSISELTFNNKTISLQSLNKAQKIDTISQLPSSILPKILDYINEQVKAMKKDYIVEIPAEDGDDMELQEVYISPVDGTLPSLIRLLYNYNLKDVYAGQLTLMSEYKIPDTFINNSTPAELTLYYALIQQEAERRQSDQDNKPESPSMPTPPQGIE